MAKKLPKKYLYGGFHEKVEKAENYFDKGFIIEGFTILFAVIEQRLKQSWLFYLRNQNGKKYYDDFEPRFSWEFPQIIRNYRELGIMNEDEYQKFTSFKSGRDKAVHYLPFPLETDKVDMPILKQEFKDGLKANDISFELQKKFPLIPEEELGKLGDFDKQLEWTKKEIEKTKEILKKKSQL